ncbi:hypothetical protein S40285_00671 [Stachybotrys chlorohalonatus IBT 40285]|uniref:Zn(2)-C6 fungal-type domain-containing protein n=1 Tax=Stachybotrys chlorohalonatus (strain IBT 40285) TaxID=1283841 RepID=A0A084R2J3_STAC4|nr:hypothetical protein S40285_00671 [Stachybotrys chlorohalonata IBT 40285]
MDAAHIFRQGLGTVPPRQHQPFIQARRPPSNHDDLSDGDGSHRVAHTLTACCRCRQRKTRCDPTLPRCLPCERSGSVCEYLDTTKGRKINRLYVIKLQDKVRALEAELAQFTDDDHDYSGTGEDMVRPGGMIRLNGSDETPRYLGPSSGIAMSRLLMEEAKRYTESARISDLVPDVRVRKEARMQSIQMTGLSNGRKRSIYPMSSELPAESLPTRAIADKLIELYIQKAQVFWPILHDKVLQNDLEAVYRNDTDPYRNFVIRMVFAISMQKLDTQYAGLADSYYVAAMQYIQDVIRPKDLKTLQCLVLVGQYSLLTPTRTPVYYVIGLATRICHQEGLTDESTIATGYNLDPQTIDMRRRLVWVVAGMELGLAHSMGRPSGFARGNDNLDVEFFATVDDEFITESGIQPGPPSPRKLVAIHFYKMRMCQAEIRRSLYEKKRSEPKSEAHPWYEHMEKRLKEWLDTAPSDYPFAKAWFVGRYHQMKVFLYRPSPQIPKPSPRAAQTCFESSAFIINHSFESMEAGSEDITWVFILALNMSLNTVLWSTSYPDVRQAHSKDEVLELVRKSLAILDQSAERWPGSASASQLYAILSKACLQSYDVREASEAPSTNAFATPLSFVDSTASPESFQTAPSQQLQYLNAPQFGYVFDSPPESMNNFAFDPNYPPPQPSFRSNSIFRNPGTTDLHGRRFSYFPPDFTQPSETIEEASPPITTPEHSLSSPPEQLPTPPDSIPPGVMPPVTPSANLSSPEGMPPSNHQRTVQPPRSSPHKPQNQLQQPQPPHHMATFSVEPTSQPSIQQKPLPPPTTISDWFSPPPPFISPYNFGPVNNNFFNDAMAGSANLGQMPAQGMVMQGLPELAHLNYAPERQGSLTPSQQIELMNVLETEGVGDIDAFLSNGNNIALGRWF